MPHGSKGKSLAYPYWLAGKSLSTIQKAVCPITGDQPSSVKGWVLDWERGKQGTWKPTIK
jgi:hypothetical protein